MGLLSSETVEVGSDETWILLQEPQPELTSSNLLIFPSTITWTHSQILCQELGGKLWEPGSFQELEDVKSFEYVLQSTGENQR